MWGVAGGLNAGQGIAGVGRQQPRHVFRFGQGGLVGQGAAEIFAQSRADCTGKCAGVLQTPGEVFGVVGQPEGFECGRMTGGVFTYQDEIACIGDQHETVTLPIAADLDAVRGQPSIIIRGFYFGHAAFGELSFLGLALLHLLGRVEPKVGMARALVGEFADTDHFGFESVPNSVQQIL